jgi:predicted metal-dependent phosphoesterase TrpH
MIFDLHSHSNKSDGELSPADLVTSAIAAGVDVLAITDHDLTCDLQPLRQLHAQHITLIQGVEFSTMWRKMGVHLVGLNIDPSADTIIAGVKKQQQIREVRARQIAAKLEKAGLPAALEGAQRVAVGSYIGRPHFAKYMAQSGFVGSESKAFKRYLGAGKVGDIKHLWPAWEEVIDWIKQAGGTAVLAHPMKYKLSRSKLIELCRDFKSAGGQAIEVVSGAQSTADTMLLSSICKEGGFLASCGSDFHRAGQVWASLGCFPALPNSCAPVWECW